MSASLWLCVLCYIFSTVTLTALEINNLENGKSSNTAKDKLIFERRHKYIPTHKDRRKFMKSDEVQSASIMAKATFGTCQPNGVIVDTDGDVIQSPNYPANYPNDLDTGCSWQIIPDSNTLVQITVNYFELEGDDGSGSCVSDRVDIYDDLYQNELNKIGSYCGTTIPGVFTSTGHGVVVIFYSDDVNTFQGFRFTVSFVTNPAACPNSPVTFDQDGGTISSPGYPNNYPNSVYCEWIITAPSNMHVHLVPEFFHLEEDCSSDSLFVEDGSLSREFCGTAIHDMVSRDDILGLIFESDAENSFSGFRIKVYFVDSIAPCSATEVYVYGELPQTTITYITSPGIDDYENNRDCRWRFIAPPGSIVLLFPYVFDLEHSTNCQHDYLNVHEDDKLIGQYCGTPVSKGLRSMVSMGNELVVHFHSDSSITSYGFEILVLAVFSADECLPGGTFALEHNALITSPNYPADFQVASVCVWVVISPPGQFVHIQKNSFTLTDCPYDFLVIQQSSAPPNFFCGEDDLPRSLAFSVDFTDIYIYFVSDNMFNVGGFSLTVRHFFPPDACSATGLTIYHDEAVIQSAGPPYLNNAICKWKIEAPLDQRIVISPAAFQLQDSMNCMLDRISISDGISYFESFCGPLASSGLKAIQSDSNILFVDFITDGDTVDLGFAFTVYHTFPADTCSVTPVVVAHDFAVIMSPNFPDDYLFNTNCVWQIVAPNSQYIYLQFGYLDIEPGSAPDLCDYDWLIVDDDYGMIQEYCGYYDEDHLPVYASDMSRLYIEFYSDDFAVYSGFNLTVTHIYDSDTCSDVPVLVPFDFWTISSIGYGSADYPNDALCRWEILAPKRWFVLVEIEDIDLQIEPSGECALDGLHFYDDDDVSKTFCGTMESTWDRVVSTRNVLYAEFYSDATGSGRGFSFSINHIPPYDTCGYTEIVHNGTTITSPDFPTHFYQNNLDCEWVLRAPPYQHVYLIFNYFELQPSDDCQTEDYLAIDDPPDLSTATAYFCGTKLAEDWDIWVSSANTFALYLHTDSTYIEHGFSITVVFIPVPSTCSETQVFVVEDGVSIPSPNYPGDYPNSIICRWKIIAPLNHFIYLVPDAFHLELSRGCELDGLTLQDGDEMLGPYCGFMEYNGLGPIASKTNVLYMDFYTDTGTAGSGFEFNVTHISPPATCSATEVLVVHDGAVITSPAFPGNYHDNAVCNWHILAPENKYIYFVPDYFLLEESRSCINDGLTIFDGDVYHGIFCGTLTSPSALRDFVTTTNEMRLQFSSDSSATYPGFSITIHFIDDPDEVATIPVQADACANSMMYLTNDGDMFTSPNHPHNYNDSSVCRWRIQAPMGMHIYINPESFNVQLADDCSADALLVYEGISDSGELLGRYCGSLGGDGHLPFNIITYSNQMFVKFESDKWQRFPGFMFTVHFMETFDIPQGTAACDGGVSWIYEPDTAVSSASFPGSFDGEVTCQWQIRADPTQRVYLAPEIFDVELSENCQNDAFMVFDGTSSGPLLGKFCGLLNGTSTMGNHIISTSNQLFVLFTADESTGYSKSMQYSGFRFAVKFFDLDPCSGMAFVDENMAMIETPNYPLDYPLDVTCWWYIQAPNEQYVFLEGVSFDVEDQTFCDWDYLEVFDDYVGLGNQIGLYCGELEPSIMAPGNELVLNFVSDFLEAKAGFQLIVHFLDMQEVPLTTRECTGAIFLVTEDNFFLETPNFNAPYPNSVICRWLIEAPVGKLVRLKRESFSLEASSLCLFDSLTVYDGPTTFAPLIGTYCGDEETSTAMPKFLESTQHLMYLEFISDIVFPSPGFRIIVNIIEPDGCSGFTAAISTTASTITSPGYPAPYPNDARCSWIIEADGTELILLSAFSFDLEESENCEFDALIVYDGNTKWHDLLGRYCGGTKSEHALDFVRSTTNWMFVEFETDVKNYFLGFNLVVTFVETGPVVPPIQSSCGQPAILPTMIRIVGGEEARENSWPWMVSLRIFNFHFCGGNIINKRWILTAAHCLEYAGQYGLETIKVVAGDHDLHTVSPIEQQIGVDSLHIHESYFYNNTFIRDDIGLIKLDRDLVFRDEISPICLVDVPIPPNFLCVSTGWGDTLGTSDNTILQQVHLMTIDNEVCRQPDWNTEVVNEDMLCAGFTEAGKGICYGDSGGPLVCYRHDTWRLYGLVSWGYECAGYKKPGVFTRVSSYLSWIDMFVNGDYLPPVGINECISLYEPVLLDDPPGDITSPGYTLGQNYENNHRCAWLIDAGIGQVVRLQFIDLDVEYQLHCGWDRVTAYDGRYLHDPQLAKVCGDNLPAAIISSYRYMYVTFESDSIGTASGFHAHYTSVTAPVTPGPTAIPPGPSGNCGVPDYNPTFTRIVGGIPAHPHTWPWMVSIQDTSMEHVCGGSIAHSHWIITAAHCVYNRGKDDLRVIIKEHDLLTSSGYEQVFRVSDIIVHPFFNSFTDAYDVALLRLSVDIVMDDKAKPVCVPTDIIPEYHMCVITGWGKTEGTGNENILNQVNVPILPTSLCNEETSYDGSVTDDMLCAGFMQGLKDACQGDSGGPLVCYQRGSWYLHGITSWGFMCAQPNYPGVYARVSVVSTWIELASGDEIKAGY